jgi:hypothetical protein
LHYRVLITGTPELLETDVGQQALALLVNLVARICPSVRVVVPAWIRLLVRTNPLLEGQFLSEALENLPDKIWGAAKPRPQMAANSPDLVISVGPPPRPQNEAPHLQLTFGNWWGAVAESTEPVEMELMSRWCLGPLVAACLGASSVFKAALRRFADRFPDLVNENTRWDLRPCDQCLSLLDYSLGRSDSAHLGGNAFSSPLVFISAGAICSATAYALHTAALAVPRARIFEPKKLDPPGLNRYLTASASDLDRAKPDIMAPWLFCSDGVDCRYEPFSQDSGPTALGSDAIYIVGVDHVPSRWAAQQAWPSLLVVGATEHDQIRVSVHVSPLDNKACARCLDVLDPQTALGEVIPAISFVSGLAGVMIAAELLKLTTLELAEYRLCNVVGGRLLQLGQWNWESKLYERSPDCELCIRGQIAA